MFQTLTGRLQSPLRQLNWCRTMLHSRYQSSSSGSPLVDVSVNNSTGVATVTMQRPPVNSMSLEFLQELSSAFTQLQENQLHKPDMKRANVFWTAFQETWLNLYGASYPTVAVINGHSPAGGCLIALTCEYRVMVGPQFNIGLNETKLGIVPPKWVSEMMMRAISRRQAELALVNGSLFTAEEAVQLAVDKADALACAEKFLAETAKIPATARSLTKMALRMDIIDWLQQNRDLDRETFLGHATKPEQQAIIEQYLQALSKKKANAKSKEMLSLRPILRSLPNLATRAMSSQGKLVDIAVNDKTGVATVTMQRPPVNGLNLELLQDLSSAFQQLEDDRSRGMILTSSSSTVFSAGLDIMEMYKPNPDRVKAFWTTLQDGHSPAGGCLLAMSCEYRVMVGPKFSIGLNETQLGIVAPKWFMASMLGTISRREAELALTTGRMFSTDEALKIGLIDEVATDKADAISRSEKFLASISRIPPVARKLTKLGVRHDALDWLQQNKDLDLSIFLAFVSQPVVQKGLEKYLEALKAKQAK
ncbi:hypothetical protein B566_EDAN014075 [Ephemera danica]|nr:hypothetical protein B566_EDAN014075 [Ephemera danica]